MKHPLISLLLAILSTGVLLSAPAGDLSRFGKPECGTMQPHLSLLSNSHAFTLSVAPLQMESLAGCQPKLITGGDGPIQYTYNPSNGMPATIKGPKGQSEYSYNARGFLEKMKDPCPVADAGYFESEITYDTEGRRISHDRQAPKDCFYKGFPGNPHSCKARYVSRTEFVNVSDGEEFTTKIKFNERGLPESYVESGGGGFPASESFKYDASGKVVESVIDSPWRVGVGPDCKALTAKYTYDTKGRLLSMDTGVGNTYGDLFIKYDDQGRAVEVRITDWHSGYDEPCTEASEPRVYRLHY